MLEQSLFIHLNVGGKQNKTKHEEMNVKLLWAEIKPDVFKAACSFFRGFDRVACPPARSVCGVLSRCVTALPDGH